MNNSCIRGESKHKTQYTLEIVMVKMRSIRGLPVISSIALIKLTSLHTYRKKKKMIVNGLNIQHRKLQKEQQNKTRKA